ncbi:MAG: hypothetical protein BWY78_01307 [Alphaproteobacteria bacterium ADurb.Bin438]|nr:MAG: hypothetical protein BWY78_01307 [Alphaproteobacteria bacterium ADurb.Bin438]
MKELQTYRFNCPDEVIRKGIEKFSEVISIKFDEDGCEVCELKKGEIDNGLIENALKFLNDTKMSLPVKEIEMLLAKLRVTLKKKENSSSSEAGLIAAYSDFLKSYPGDLVREVLTNYPKIIAHKLRKSNFSEVGWFPDVATLIALIEDKLTLRQSFEDCLIKAKHQNLKLLEDKKGEKAFTRFDEIFSEKMSEFINQGDHFMVAGKKASDYVDRLKGGFKNVA